MKELGLEEQTLIVITSDNGPWANYGNHAGSAGGLREAKATTFDGGNRIPCIMYWKGHTQAGTICNKLASNIDLLPIVSKIIFRSKNIVRPISQLVEKQMNYS